MKEENWKRSGEKSIGIWRKKDFIEREILQNRQRRKNDDRIDKLVYIEERQFNPIIISF